MHHDGHMSSLVSNAMTPQCQAEHALMMYSLKNIHSTMSGGGCLFMDHRLESPKHRVSRGLHVNYYVHRRQYSKSQSTTIRRVKSTPDPDTCEKVSRYTSHVYGILLQMYALPVAESSIYTTNLYHDTPPICIAILLRKY